MSTTVPPPARCLLLFTKPARPGRVKTRLTGEGAKGLSPRQAAELHAAFLGDLVQRLLPATVAAPGGGPTPIGAEMRLRLAWALDEPEASDGPAALPILSAELARAGDAALPLEMPRAAAVDAVAQRGDDLGERLYTALRAAAGEHPGGIAAVGSDHPALPLARVRQGFASLADHDVVLGPAGDGGYYLIALRAGAVHRELFHDIQWSTGTVRAATEERCRRLGLSLALLPVEHDVDDPTDLDRLAWALSAGPAADADCPRTRRLLAAWGRLPLEDAEREAAR